MNPAEVLDDRWGCEPPCEGTSRRSWKLAVTGQPCVSAEKADVLEISYLVQDRCRDCLRRSLEPSDCPTKWDAPPLGPPTSLIKYNVASLIVEPVEAWRQDVSRDRQQGRISLGQFVRDPPKVPRVSLGGDEPGNPLPQQRTLLLGNCLSTPAGFLRRPVAIQPLNQGGREVAACLKGHC